MVLWKLRDGRAGTGAYDRERWSAVASARPEGAELSLGESSTASGGRLRSSAMGA